MGNHFTKPLQGVIFRNFSAEIMNRPDDLNMEDMGIDGTGMKKGVRWNLHNENESECPQKCVGNNEIFCGIN